MGVDIVGGAAGRLITKVNIAGQVAVGSGNVTGVGFGVTAWGQVTASLAAESLLSHVTVELGGSTFSSTQFSVVDIGIGGAGSEVVIASVPVWPTYSGSLFRLAVGELRFPNRVATGQRIAVRIADPGNNFNSQGVTITVYGITYSNVETF